MYYDGCLKDKSSNAKIGKEQRTPKFDDKIVFLIFISIKLFSLH